MKLGNIKNCFLIILFLINTNYVLAADKIESVPLINLEDLSPTFEEEKDVLEKNEEQISSTTNLENNVDLKESFDNEKIYINITALDKITAKTSEIRMAVGEKKSFGPLEIKALKCQFSNNTENVDTVAYIQVKDLSTKDNNQVFLFNGWSFASSPTLQSIDHPVYDLWITSCENI
jgi:hypothetical protein